MDDKSQDLKAGVDLHKKTTRVNVSMVAAVVVFFLLAALVIWVVDRHPPQTKPAIEETK